MGGVVGVRGPTELPPPPPGVEAGAGSASLCLRLNVHVAREGPSPMAQVSSPLALPWPLL